VNVNVDEEETGKRPDLLRIDESTARESKANLAKLRARRDRARYTRSIDGVKKACREGQNVMPALIEAAHAEATLGEICDAMRDVFGTWREGREF
jgi:methylmalonyl-CoA mutase N-terminal domain/subunit